MTARSEFMKAITFIVTWAAIFALACWLVADWRGML